MKVYDVADYFLTLQNEDCEDYISNLKLQKLCYYAQGFHLALKGSRLFPDDLEAWQHGPVVRALYKKYSSFGSGALTVTDGFDWDKISKDNKDLLNEVFMQYAQYSAWKLRDMTHVETPWINARKRKDKILNDGDMISFFKELLA